MSEWCFINKPALPHLSYKHRNNLFYVNKELNLVGLIQFFRGVMGALWQEGPWFKSRRGRASPCLCGFPLGNLVSAIIKTCTHTIGWFSSQYSWPRALAKILSWSMGARINPHPLHPWDGFSAEYQFHVVRAMYTDMWLNRGSSYYYLHRKREILHIMQCECWDANC